jgi:hypothetical protein
LSILAMLYKSGVRIAPIIFGGITALGAIELLGSLVGVVGDDFALRVAGINAVIGGLLYPFIAYVLAQFLYLFIDICKAMLSLNRRGA